ncbi:hypothetical protein A3860_26020 [Niastella vici]|uniref:Uncharacterized protein n=1 Tax=Niastella vici TaxID=1703345 RepID=A0A1V9FWS9_9BACT|nr:HEPN domain-containing protein [Niastella vici]OQP62774.1 hypothetical protein A3860_26020 [Niastella vici]
MDLNTFFNIRRRVGTLFLQYVLNCDRQITDESSLEELDFSNQQIGILSELRGLIKKSERTSASSPLYDVSTLFIINGLTKESRFNELRKMCGGEILTIHSTDAIENFIFEYAIKIYPVLLFMPNEEYHFHQWVHTNQVMQESISFIKLLKKDPTLSKLVVSDESYSRFIYLLDNGALVSSTEPTIIVDFIYRCFINCCYRMDFAPARLIQEIRSNLEILKKIALGEEFEYSCFRGLYGMGIRKMESFECYHNVVIRPISSLENPLFCIRKTASILGNDGGVIGAILELKQKTKGISTPKGNISSTFTSPALTEIISLLKFSIVFSTGIVSAPFNETFYDISLPLHSSLLNSREMTQGTTTIIDSENCTEIISWLELLKKNDLGHLKVPLKRLQYAIFERLDPEDSLLDAFIAWEGIFSSKFETTFQVTGAIAKFLEENPAKRQAFFKRLQHLYSLRSFIAHGEPREHKETKGENIHDIRNEVIAIAVNCLKKLLQTPELLKLRPKERVKTLLVFS